MCSPLVLRGLFSGDWLPASVFSPDAVVVPRALFLGEPLTAAVSRNGMRSTLVPQLATPVPTVNSRQKMRH